LLPCTLPTKFPTLLGFPELNVHLIRATSQTLSAVYGTIPSKGFYSSEAHIFLLYVL
jgi:hypothetical protein